MVTVSRRHAKESSNNTILLTEVQDMTEQLFSIRDCGKAVGVAAHKIAYAHSQEKLPEPQFRVAGKRIYTAEDVQMVAKYFAEKHPRKDSHGG